MFIITPLGSREHTPADPYDQQYDLLSEYEQQAERLITPINY